MALIPPELQHIVTEAFAASIVLQMHILLELSAAGLLVTLLEVAKTAKVPGISACRRLVVILLSCGNGQI